MVEINVVHGDILSQPCDLIILKHADGFYGVDRSIATITNFNADIPEGNHAFSRGAGLKARKILYIGVGPLVDFRYEKIRKFAFNSLKIAFEGKDTPTTICTPVHGPGYGLDDIESFLSLISGFQDALDDQLIPHGLKRLDVVEINHTRAKRFQSALRNFKSINKTEAFTRKGFGVDVVGPRDFGAKSEAKEKLFVAMPFSDKT